jgi:type IV secretory pathway ATPase VirB11/archaellum biosynthesis ATPase
VLSADLAALLAELVARRASIVVAAGPSGAGKTTLLTALLDALPPETRRVYLRGCYEPFDFLAATEPGRTALLVNEISGHLPIYLWGPGVRRLLEARQAGYQFAATAHATGLDDFVAGLAGYPLRLPADLLAGIDLLVLLAAWRVPAGIRRVVHSVVTLSEPARPGELAPLPLAAWHAPAGHATPDLAAAQSLWSRLGAGGADLETAVRQRASALRPGGPAGAA